MATWKQPAVFRQQHNDPSVLSRRLIESAAEAVLFVSVQRKRGGGKPYEKKEEGAEAHTHHTGGGSRDQSSAPRTETDNCL